MYSQFGGGGTPGGGSVDDPRFSSTRLPTTTTTLQSTPRMTFPSSTTSTTTTTSSNFGVFQPNYPNSFNKIDQSQLDSTLMRDRFRVLGSVVFAMMFHWMIIYGILFVTKLVVLGSLKFDLLFDTSVLYYMFMTNLCVGLIVLLHGAQIQWSKLQTLDQIRKHVVVYVETSTVGYFFGYLIIGLFLTTFYLGLYNGEFTSGMDCSGTDGCLNDKYLFIMFSSMYSTGSVFIEFRKSTTYQIRFPEIEQSTREKLRYCYTIYFIESVKHVLQNLPVTYLIYYFMGTTFRLWASKSVNLNLGVNLLETFSQFISMKLFLYVFITSTFTIGTFKVCWEIMRLCLTQRRVFPLDVDAFMNEGDGVTLLPDALKPKSTNNYMRNLAYFDLYCMTDKIDKRVEELFKIGYKGGRVMIWSIIKDECLAAIHNTSDLTRKFVSSEQDMRKQLISDASKKLDEKQDQISKSGHSHSVFFGVGNGNESINTINNESETNSLNIRRRGYYPMRPLESSTVSTKQELRQAPLSPVQIFMRGTFNREKAKGEIRRVLRGSRWTEFYFEKKFESQISALLQDSQVVILSVQSLMNIVNIYLRQSSANAVQRDLALIIGTLIELHEAMDMLKKIRYVFKAGTSSNTRILGRNSQKTQDHLTSVCTNALLELHCHFHQYFEFMPISFEHQTKLRSIVSNHNCLI